MMKLAKKLVVLHHERSLMSSVTMASRGKASETGNCTGEGVPLGDDE